MAEHKYQYPDGQRLKNAVRGILRRYGNDK